MKLSVVLNTARSDFPYVGSKMKGVFIFEPTIRSLATQEEPIHELIIVDGLHETGRAVRFFAERGWRGTNVLPFDVGCSAPESPLYPDYVTICAAKNTGLRAATGDAVWFIDDGAEFPPHATRIVAEWLDAGYWPSALVHYYENGYPASTDGARVPADDDRRSDPALSFERLRAHAADLFGPGEGVRDARYAQLRANRPHLVAGGEWWRGYTAALRSELEAVGGFDETLDGVKSVEDPDLGLRMVRAHGKRVVVDRRLWVVEHRAGGYDPSACRYPAVNAKCNTALLRRNEALGTTRWSRIPAADIATIRRDVCDRDLCRNRARCSTEHLGANFTPPAPTTDEIEAFAAWRRAYVEEAP